MVNGWIKYQFKEIGSPNKRLNGIVLDVRSPVEEMNGMDAAIEAVNKIVANYAAPYTLLVSGGVDSQAMLLAWKKSGHPFKAVHYSYNGENSHDYYPLNKICSDNDIQLHVKRFEAREFICGPDLIKYAKQYDCQSPQILTYIKLAELHPETVLMSGNFLCHNTASLNYTILGLARYAEVAKNFIPFFFQSTPNLTYAFQKTDAEYVAKHYGNPDNSWDAYEMKCDTFKDHGFNIIPQEGKLTGFEKIKESFDSFPISGKDKIRYASKPSRRPFDVLFRYKVGSEIGEYSEQVDILRNTINTN